jgi:hypothetical protein
MNNNIPSFFTVDDVANELGCDHSAAQNQIQNWMKQEYVTEVGGGFFQVL